MLENTASIHQTVLIDLHIDSYITGLTECFCQMFTKPRTSNYIAWKFSGIVVVVVYFILLFICVLHELYVLIENLVVKKRIRIDIMKIIMAYAW